MQMSDSPRVAPASLGLLDEIIIVRRPRDSRAAPNTIIAAQWEILAIFGSLQDFIQILGPKKLIS